MTTLKRIAVFVAVFAVLGLATLIPQSVTFAIGGAVGSGEHLVRKVVGLDHAEAETKSGGAVSVAHSPRVCFSAKHWGPAPKAVRPCVRITGVQEDGSFNYAVSDADGTVRYTAGIGALDR
jgi:hypothetical protein